MRILVVEDEKKVASFIRKGLKEESYSVDVAYDGEEAAVLAQNGLYDLVILDLMLPKRDGLEVLKIFSSKKDSPPVLILSAKDTVQDKVKGLSLGAEDYLTKPFSFEELLARVRVILRRRTEAKFDELKIGDLTLNLLTHKVQFKHKLIELTAKEFSLLEYFMRHPDMVLTRTMILQHVWGIDFDTFTNVVDVYVRHLRDKIDINGHYPKIETVRGVGYVLKSLSTPQSNER